MNPSNISDGVTASDNATNPLQLIELPVPARKGGKQFNARGMPLLISWEFAPDGTSVQGRLTNDNNSRFSLNFSLGFAMPQVAKAAYSLGTSIIVTLWLEKRNNKGKLDVIFNGNIPLDNHDFFNGEIGVWAISTPGTTPAPGPGDDPMA